MMNSSMLLALTLFATLVTGNDGNLQDSKHWNNQTRDIKAFPACVTDSDCAAVTGLGGEVADFKCFQSMCFPWANKELQGEQVENISFIVFMLIITTVIVRGAGGGDILHLHVSDISMKSHLSIVITQATCTKSSQCDSGHCFRYFT